MNRLKPLFWSPPSPLIMLDITDNERKKESAIAAKKRLGMIENILNSSLLGGFTNTGFTLCCSEISTNFCVSNGEIVVVNWTSISGLVAITVLMSGLKYNVSKSECLIPLMRFLTVIGCRIGFKATHIVSGTNSNIDNILL